MKKNEILFIFLSSVWSLFGFYALDFLGFLNKGVIETFIAVIIAQFIGYLIITKSFKINLNGKRH